MAMDSASSSPVVVPSETHRAGAFSANSFALFGTLPVSVLMIGIFTAVFSVTEAAGAVELRGMAVVSGVAGGRCCGRQGGVAGVIISAGHLGRALRKAEYGTWQRSV